MAVNKTYQRSFAGGEVAEEMLGRFDLPHFQTGLKKSLNGYTLPHGPWLNRQGLEHVKECKDGGTSAVRLIPFIFDENQAYALEIGETYVRIHTEGATVLEANKTITGITAANPAVVSSTAHGFLDGEEIFLASIVGMTELNGRYCKVANKNPNDFELTDLQGNNIDSSAFTAYSSAGTAARVYTQTTPYAAADLFELKHEQSEDVMTICHPDYDDQELTRVAATNWTFAGITYGPSIAAPANVAVAATVGSGSGSEVYVVTSISETILEVSLASSSDTVVNDLSIGSNYNTITWDAVTGAARYNVYKQSNGLFGYIGQTDELTFKDDNITPDLLNTPPEDRLPFSGADDYPAAVSYFDQRRVFGGTNNDPKKIELMRPGTESNSSKTIPQQDNDAISVRLKSRENSKIRHMVPLNSLLIFTTREEWKLFSADGSGLTPGSIDAKPQSTIGCSHRRPIVQGDALLFVANLGSHIYDMQFSLDSENASGKYKPRDISIIAPQMFEVDGVQKNIVDWAYSREPYSMIFAPRDDGKMIGVTYLSDQKPDVIAFHLHETLNGDIESCCAIPESNGEEMFYFVVKRMINGVDRRFIERLHSRKFAQIQDAFFVDAGTTIDTPVTITGITAANPPVVTVGTNTFADGAVIQIEDIDFGNNSAIDATTKLKTTWGMAELNGRRFTVANGTGTTFELQDTAATPANIDGSAYTAWRSGGVCREEVSSITNAHHLEGETVSIFADGNVQTKKVVTGGAFTLDTPAARIHYGLEITADMETLPLVYTTVPGFGSGDFKNVNKAYVRVNRSRAIQVGPDADHLRAQNLRTTEDMGTPTRLRSEELALVVDPKLDRTGGMYIRNTDPAPLTVVSIGIEAGE